MTDLKARIAAGYKVNAEAVAEEMLRKMQLVNQARRELATAPGRSPSAGRRLRLQ